MKLFRETFSEQLNSRELFYNSLSPKFNREKVFKAGEGAGRSGSFFFFSHDSKFIIKTLTSEELKLLLKLAPSLSKHHKENPTSLLAKIFGVFQVRCSKMGDVNLILMENTMRVVNDDYLKYVFDLKGSSVARFVQGKTKNTTTLKDVNFL